MTASVSAAGPIFSEDFEGSLATQWTGKGGFSTSGEIVADPVRSGNKVLHFRSLGSGGDLFSKPIGVTKSARYRLSFQYMGRSGTGGGIIGVSLGTPGHHRWLAGVTGKGAGEKNPMKDDGRWRTYNIDFSPGDHPWFTADGGSSANPSTITSLRIMVEQHLGTPGDGHFDNISLTKCAAKCAGGSSAEPVRVSIRFHAENMRTTPPSDGGKCGTAAQTSRTTGTISAQITPGGDHQGSGDVHDTPHRSACRVPRILVRVDRVRLRVIEPGKTLQAVLKVRISSEAVHRPGDCSTNTKGTITATYDQTQQGTNGLRADRVKIGPWKGCTAHNHTITNAISSIAADASGSTWVRVTIACVAPGAGYSPRNCTA